MSKVFIAWSGNFEVACKLKEYIDAKHGYEAVVGGNLHTLNSVFVGGTIIDQMKQCDQAILLVQKNERHGGLSPNVMFEWGYLLAKLNANKMHHYFIDKPDIPSDLHGVWAFDVSTEQKSPEELAEILGKKFFESQRNTMNANKMKTIMAREDMRRLIQYHFTDTICSNFEMAQYVLCYIFSANIYSDTRDEAIKDMNKFYSQMGEIAMESAELRLAVSCAIVSIGFFKTIQYIDDEQYIGKNDFEDFLESYYRLFEQVETLEKSEVKDFLIITIGDFITYLYLLMINGNEIDDEKKVEFCKRLYNYSAEMAKLCDEFESASPKLNTQLCCLIRAYMYRGMFCALDCMERIETGEGGERSESAEERLIKIKDCLRKSLNERKKLYNEYNKNNVNAQFYGNIEMEYYLALAEYRLYEDDEFQRERYKQNLMRYLNNADKAAAERRVFTEKIRGYLNK